MLKSRTLDRPVLFLTVSLLFGNIGATYAEELPSPSPELATTSAQKSSAKKKADKSKTVEDIDSEKEHSEDSYGSSDGTPPAPAPKVHVPGPSVKLPEEGKPGDVRLVVSLTDVVTQERGYVPKIPLPPFHQWNKWMDEHEVSSHSSIDWMNEKGEWWHAELHSSSDGDPQYMVGKGEFVGTGLTVYGVFISPGRTDPEGQKVILDEKLSCDYHTIEAEARKYARNDKEDGDRGTNGNGKENVGLGGPAFKPSQNCNTFVHFLLKKAGVNHAAPPGAVGWNTVPKFPVSTDADDK